MMQIIIIDEIKKTISQSSSKKILDENEISNLILKETSAIFLLHLYRIFNIYLTNDYYSNYFRILVIIILSKSKKNYFIFKSYRSIPLLNIIEKIMKFILARRIAYLAKIYQLLFVTHMRDRRLKLYEYNIYYLLKRIYQI